MQTSKKYWLGKGVTGTTFRKNGITAPKPDRAKDCTFQDLARRRNAAYARLARTIGLSWLGCRKRGESTEA